MVAEGVVATVVDTAAAAVAVAEVVDREEGGSEGTESLVIMCARKTALYTSDSERPMIDSHVSPKGGTMNSYPNTLSGPFHRRGTGLDSLPRRFNGF